MLILHFLKGLGLESSETTLANSSAVDEEQSTSSESVSEEESSDADYKPLQRADPFALHALCEKDDLAGLNAALQETDDDGRPFYLNSRTALDETYPLHVAIMHHRLSCVEALLEAKARTNITIAGTPLLHLALTMGTFPGKAIFALQCVALFLRALNDAELTVLVMC